MAGRKSLKEEIKIVERLTELSEPTFNVIKKFLNSDKDADQKWAAEQMNKLYSKCIPIENDPENPFTVQVVQVAQSIANKNGINSSPESNSPGQPQV